MPEVKKVPAYPRQPSFLPKPGHGPQSLYPLDYLGKQAEEKFGSLEEQGIVYCNIFKVNVDI